MEQEQLRAQVFEKLKIQDLSQDEQDEILALTLDAIIKQAVIIAHDSLDEVTRTKFVTLVEEGGDLEELIEYFSQTVEGKPILTLAVEEVLAELEKEEEAL